MSTFMYKDEPINDPGNVDFGSADISGIGDGTVTGAIVELNDNIKPVSGRYYGYFTYMGLDSYFVIPFHYHGNFNVTCDVFNMPGVAEGVSVDGIITAHNAILLKHTYPSYEKAIANKGGAGYAELAFS